MESEARFLSFFALFSHGSAFRVERGRVVKKVTYEIILCFLLDLARGLLDFVMCGVEEHERLQ